MASFPLCPPAPPRDRAAAGRDLAWLVAFALFALALAGCSGPPTRGAQMPSARSAPPAVEYDRGFFAGKGGVTLVRQSWRPRGPARSALVIVHGLKDHGSRYADVAERLALEGHAVYVFDLRGHGLSAGERVYVESFDDYVDDLAAYVAYARGREPGVPLFVLGHSMGGAIATTYALTRRPAPDGLLLSGAALAADVSWFKAAGTSATAALAPHAGVFQLDLHEFSRDPKVIQDGERDPLVYQDAAPARTAKELLGAIDRLNEGFERLTLPLLVLHGDGDRVTLPEGSRELYRRAKSADKTLVIYPRLWHDLLHEPERERVFADIRQWLGSRARPAADAPESPKAADASIAKRPTADAPAAKPPAVDAKPAPAPTATSRR
jgi:acylglycerol lipase